MSDDWQKLDNDKAAKWLKAINPHLAPVPFTPENTTLRIMKLPFYRDYVLYELTDHAAVPAARKYALASETGDVLVIDWTNQPIYAANEKSPLILNENTVVPYVKFFFNYVRGRNNRFQFVESIDDLRWVTEPAIHNRKTIQDTLEPIMVIAHDVEGTYHLEAFMAFKDALFKTKIHVKKDGVIGMSEEEVKFENLSIMQDAV